MPKPLPLIAVVVSAWMAFAPFAGAAEAFITTVERVVDGDTVILNDGSRVRLIGVDTPELTRSRRLESQAERAGRTIDEMAVGGRAAAAFLRNWIENKDVRIVLDPANEKNGHKDIYGRTLAYLYVAPDDKISAALPAEILESEAFSDGFVNGLIVLSGHGTAYVRFPYAHRRAFRAYEAEARRHGWGLWKN